MAYIHHVQGITEKNFPKLQAFIGQHAETITRHAVGYLGKSYIVIATEDFREELRAMGFLCRITS